MIVVCSENDTKLFIKNNDDPFNIYKKYGIRSTQLLLLHQKSHQLREYRKYSQNT
jgi:hypothetical protein